MNAETAMRMILDEESEDSSFWMWLNDEDRVVLSMKQEDGQLNQFVVVGDRVVPWQDKPPTLRLVTEGFDAHMSMGEASE